MKIKLNPKWFVPVSLLVAIALHLILRIFWPSVAAWPLIILNIGVGLPLIYRIIMTVVRGNFGADLLAVIAFLTGLALQEYLAATLILLMLSGGEALEAYALRKASSVLRALAKRMPLKAHRKTGEKIEEIPLSHIAIDDEIVIFPHETVPVDGQVIAGHGSMDEAYLTGEPYQVAKAPGADVLSGAINGESLITIKATRHPSDSRYAQIMQVMEQAEQKRPQLRRLADRLGAIFGPFALIFAGVAWYVTQDATIFLAILMVATPCPLLIAIPITLISAISMAAKRGIIIKDPTVLELLPTIQTAIFDKTGTLTYGKPELTDVLPADGLKINDILQKTASLERYSKHPLSQAVIQAAEKANLTFIDATQVTEKPGQGLQGMVDGDEIRVTHRKKYGIEHPDKLALLPETASGLECLILIKGEYAATLRFRDAPRADGRSFVKHLKPSHRITKVMLVSGDRASEVTYLADLLGIKETLASQSPEQKVEIVRAETAKAPTLFMGDGINDAPALATATVGIAFGQQSSVTSEAAGAVIMDNSLEKVDELIHISTAMRIIMLQSALGGIGLSLIAMGFAAAGMITPVAGALLQEVIDILAIMNALRLTFGDKIVADLNK